jgi:hypothetical protein
LNQCQYDKNKTSMGAIMQKHGEETHVTATEASGGRPTGHMRWVLGIGLLIAIVAMSAAWIIPAVFG